MSEIKFEISGWCSGMSPIQIVNLGEVRRMSEIKFEISGWCSGMSPIQIVNLGEPIALSMIMHIKKSS